MADFKFEHRLDLGDLALVLAVERTGSLTSAAKVLAISHPTVFRKARDLESRFGTQLFYRDRTGITLTAAGTAIAEIAARLDAEVRQAERAYVDQDVSAAGELCVATVDTLVCGPLPGQLKRFQSRHPEITLDLIVDIAMADLSRREVDVAIRAGGEPPEDLVGRRLCTIAVAIYRARDSDDVAAADVFRQRWVTPDDRLSHLASAKFLREQGVHERAALRADSLLALTQAVAAGFGLGILPCYLADLDPRLTRVGAPLPALESGLWFLTRAELRKVAKVRMLSNFLSDDMQTMRDLFEGRRPQGWDGAA